MARGDTELAFARAAAQDGIQLERARVPWINERGHFGVDALPPDTADILDSIFEALGGSAAEQRAKRLTSLPGDFYHRPSRTFIEVDESQHFTSARALTLTLYPDDAELGYSLAAYRALCSEWSTRADKFRATKPAPAFGAGGRQRQRAYYDALRDLVTPALGLPPLIRVPAPERDGAVAYERVRDALLRLK